MKYFTFIFLLSLLIVSLQAQETIKTTGSAQIELLRTESRNNIEIQVKELATIDALERAFGKVIVQGNATFIENIQTGAKVETNSVFNTIANTSVGGKVEKELSCNFSEVKGYKIVEGQKEEITEIKCEITLLASKLTTPPAEFDVFTASCTNPGCRSDFFKNNGDFYVFFRSPISGYLCIFLDDGSEAFRLLPYRGMRDAFESAAPVKADQQYVLFSKELNKLPLQNDLVDEYKLTTTKPQELNRIFVIFCEEPIRKPSLTNTSMEQLLPFSMPSEEFQKWIQKNRSFFGNKMEVGILDVSISSK